MKHSVFLAALLVLSSLPLMSSLFSQGTATPPRTAAINAKPSFTILPLLQEFEARPGQRVKFGFEVETQERDTKLSVQIVGLQQSESGLITPDEQSQPPGNVQLFGPSVVQLRAGQRYNLEGVIVLPLDAANSINYGLLVTDLGRTLDQKRDSGDNQVQVEFVTRYLLRVHINVLGTRAIQPSDLEVLSAELVEEQGNCLARVRLRNPHPGTCDVSVRCRLVPEFGPALDPAFFLVLPIRRRSDEQRRPTCKVLGETTVCFESVVPHPVTAGGYRIEVDTVSGRFPHHRSTYTTQVLPNQFPDHAQAVLQIAGILRVEPAQVELSLKPRGDRLVRVAISNTSRRVINIQLKATASDGSDLPWAMVRPESFQLNPGSQRNVLVGIQQATGLQKNVYGELSLIATTLDGVTATRRPIPLAVVPPGNVPPQFEVAPVRLAETLSRPVLVTAIQNAGSVHLEPRGHLRLIAPAGQVMELNASFGKWLLPGRTGELQFPLRSLPPPGAYRLAGEIIMGPDVPPHRIEQSIQIPPLTAPVLFPAAPKELTNPGTR